MTLTTKKIAALKPREKRYSVTDGHGLTLKVQSSGTKSWVLRVSHGGRVTDIALGHWPEVSLMQARQIARRKRKELGQEPPRGYTLRDAWSLWKNLKRGRIVSYQDEKRRMERYIIGPLGSRQIDEITAPLVIQTVKGIERAGHQATLKRVLMRTREVMDLAVCAGYIYHNPVDRVSRVFAAPIVKPMPSVHWRELPAVMATMKEAPYRTQLLFAWALLSLLRPIETVKVRWDWIKDDVLTIPASEMKKSREHRLPLLPIMLDILQAAKDESPHPKSPFIWAGRVSGRHMSGQTLAKHFHETALKGRLVAHGIRSVGRSWMADHDATFEVAEACLSHVAGSSVSRAYQRSDYLAQRRQLMTSWCEHVANCAQEVGFLPSIFSTDRDLTAGG